MAQPERRVKRAAEGLHKNLPWNEALPDDAPYAEWGRWILADRATRPIGPGFTITAGEMEKRAKELAAAKP